MKNYIEVQFEERDGRARVRINESPRGQVSGAFQAPLTPAEAAERLFPRRAPGRKETAAALGHELYQALDRAGVGEALRQAVSEGRAGRAPVIVQLRFDEDTVRLAGLPWELLHDGRWHLLAVGKVDLTRYVTYGEGLAPLRVERPLRVLQVGASPPEYVPLDIPASRAALESVSGLAVECLAEPTYDALVRRLSQGPPVHVLHFDGHGGLRDGRPVLCFENKEGRADLVDADFVGHVVQDRLSLVVLNACRSAQVEEGMGSVFEGMAPALIQAGIPAVVGMQYLIPDAAAILFIEAFYQALVRGEPLTRAMAGARYLLYRGGSWYIPALYLRSEDPEGHLFPAGEPPATPPAPGLPPDVQRDQCRALAESMRETLELLKEYEEIRRLSGDPRERRRAAGEVERLRTDLARYQHEYRELGCG